ncbi:uncharacterized protein LOC110922113 [Helianthus annuus]|uniref:uncharacterized protein LOC110922113 n=1 Tax=Helianthus annuus TaxID=4232 RepID=UPI000B9016B4|nr:uncharacterized protein LOC110922113 [Helianthus annuus]
MMYTSSFGGFGVKPPNLGGFTSIPSSSSLDNHRSIGFFKDHGPLLLLLRRHNNILPFAKAGPPDWGQTPPYALRNWHLPTKKLSKSQRKPSKLSTYRRILAPGGMILLKRYISLKDQVDIVNMCDTLGRGPGGFCYPEGEDYKAQVAYMHLGRRNPTHSI